MQSLTSLLGGGGRYSRFEKLTGSGLWVPPAGAQLLHVAMAGAGAGAGTFGVGALNLGQNLPNYAYIGPGGGGGGYLEFDYPVLDRASIAYSVGVGGDGATCTVASGNTTSTGTSAANAITASNFDGTWKVPASMVTTLQAASCPVSLQASAAAAVGVNTITFNADPAALGVLAGWSVLTGYSGTALGVIQSISGNTITLVSNLTTAVTSGSRLYMNPPASCPAQIYIPSTGHIFGHVAIASATSVVALNIPTAPTANDLFSGIDAIASTVRYAGDSGGATTFGEYTAGGGFSSGSGGLFTVPGLPTIQLQSSSNFPYQISGTAVGGSAAGTMASTYQASTSGGRAGGGFMSAAFGVGAPGSNGSDGGPGCGGAMCLSTNSADPAPVGGKGGDGLLIILY
jgi:hypothetical protein